MRLRAARRLIERLYKTGQIKDNYYLHLRDHGLWFVYREGSYYFRLKYRGRVVCARNSCAFRGLKSLFLRTNELASVQGKRFDHCPDMDPKKRDFIQAVLKSQHPDFPIVAAPNLGTISFPKKDTPDKFVTQLLDSEFLNLSQQTRDEINQYQHTADITDSALLAPAVNKLATRPMRPIDRDAVKRMIVIYALKNYRPVTVDYSPSSLASNMKNGGSASGALPLVPAAGTGAKLSGTKSEMWGSAVRVNVRDKKREGVPSALPCVNFIKPEVIKKGKAARGIQVESLANYQILSLSKFEGTDFGSGSAIGLGARGYGFDLPFYLWYTVYQDTLGPVSWDDFISYLELVGMHESDKVGWEASTNINDGFPFFYVESNARNFSHHADRKLFLRAMTDTLCPFIMLDRCGFYAPWRIGSGNYLTSKGNTERHKIMRAYLCDYIERHGNRIGSQDCNCNCCIYLSGLGHPIGLPVSVVSLRLRRHAFILGDDFIAPSLGEQQDRLYDVLTDYVFGTQTKTRVCNVWDDAEFLRRRFKKDDAYFQTYRDTGRLLAKLWHGDARKSKERFKAAVLSAQLDAGDNAEAWETLIRLEDQLDGVDVVRFRQEAGKYVRRHPDIGQLRGKLVLEDMVNYRFCPISTISNVAALRKC